MGQIIMNKSERNSTNVKGYGETERNKKQTKETGKQKHKVIEERFRNVETGVKVQKRMQEIR